MSPLACTLLLLLAGAAFVAGQYNEGVQFEQNTCTTYGALRLVWGRGNYEGQVQICINGTWGWVCHNSYRAEDAQVVCRQLGFSATGATYRTYGYYGWPNSSIPIWLDGMDCVGTETTLLSCPLSRAIGSVRCSYNAIAGVVCPSGGPSCTNNDIRIVDKTTWTPFNNRGRVEICSSNSWQTICDNGWGSSDAKVACYQLGFSKNYAYAYANARYGQGYGSILWRYVACSSSESTLFQCSKLNGGYGCTHADDASIQCSGRVTGSCTNGAVRLWRYKDIGPAHDGVALYCKSNQWVPFCDDTNTFCDTGRVICQKLGYVGLLNTRQEYHYGYYDGTVDHYAFSCSSTATDLTQCTYYYHSNCYHRGDQFGTVCYSPIIGNECTDGSVRLVNGPDNSEGRVNYCYEGFWYPVCGLNSYTATLMCKAMGFNASSASTVGDSRYGSTGIISSLYAVNCNSSHTNLSQCPFGRKTASLTSCRINVAKCSTEWGLRCHNTVGCTNGQTRLVNGPIDQAGTLEICLDNVWGSACGTFPVQSAYVACKELGYTGPNPTIKGNSFYGESSGPMLYNNIICHGWEDNVAECSYQTFPQLSCSPQYAIGLICKDDCNNGDVRLTGGFFDNEGTVEVCGNRQWSYVSDANFTANNARVICRQLGYPNGALATPLLGSHFGKGRRAVRYINANCTGTEKRFLNCPITVYSQTQAEAALAVNEVASVDCVYDVPTDPPCIARPSLYDSAGSECTSGAVRLQGGSSSGEGRVEYCYNGYWSPFCKMDPKAAMVACRQLGFTQYSWGSIVEGGEFGTSRNYSIFDNITCVGSESSLSQCTPAENTECTPFCRYNLGLRCFNPGSCTNGALRLADGVIDNEGRVEVCVNGVWGSVCDQGFDVTDAHVVCQQLGHPELEPFVLNNSTFGPGQYPIVYSNFACGGYENSLSDCTKQTYPNTACSQSNVAGVLCGYDCTDGDVRLVGSQYGYEGTVEVCFDRLWGLVADSGWTQTDAEVTCRQLGYTTQGTIVQRGSLYGKPAKTIHITSLGCSGTESSVADCTVSTISLAQGKALLATSDVAGVKCYTPDQCVPPPAGGGSSCTNGELRLTGGKQSGIPEGNVEYCYQGTWSPFCSLGPVEATIICKQLGYTASTLTAIFDDGRFGQISNTSYFQNISCPDRFATDLSTCVVADACITSCPNALGLRCYEPSSCSDGDVRLVNGSYKTDGRLEVCSDGNWGSVCSTGFDPTDAYVVCNELGLGDAEPTVYNTSAMYGDGDGAIIFSDFGCEGYETNVFDCSRSSYGYFTCSRDNVVGVKCKDSCNNADVRVVNGDSLATTEGIIEVCHQETWGMVSDEGWSTEEAQVACAQLGYTTRAAAASGSSYTRPNAPFQLSSVDCMGSETGLTNCSLTYIVDTAIADPNAPTYNPAAVKCVPDEVTNDPNDPLSVVSNNPVTVSMAVIIVIMLISVVITISVAVYVCVKRKKGDLSVKMMYADEPAPLTMSGLERAGVNNPLAGIYDEVTNAEKPENPLYGDKVALVNNM
ncbi:PREDICTED: scavenger receptor cysteine-rich domain superfamily protein-like [Amphimedon queenslandica]|nr:PREDICTED: scavenger receptor cysteine-rich domain superfamily protein-like [Amphimedon queenslandica]|eukprot:XP_019854372.1 PREDICTED: scavenger receptor cysteine-rich domain superfamily protein-like [Amphimedon queenslandica]